MHEQLFGTISEYIPITKEDKDFLTSVFKTKNLRKRQYLLQAGDVCRYECFVNEGCLRQYYVDENGQEHVLMFAFENWWTSDMHSFVTGKPSLTNIEAIEDASLLLIEKENLNQLYLRIPAFERFFRIKLQRAFIAHQMRLIENMSLPADTRYQNFIEAYPQLEQRIPQKHIASYLGIAPESLSRIRAQYNKRNK